MLKNIIHFIKYNNAAVIILGAILLLGGGALAAGPENIGQKQTRVEGVDNTALLAADLSAFNMDFKIENIERDERYYYVTYGFLDLVQADGAWQYQLSQKTQKVSGKIKEDIGEYMAKFMAKHHEARVRELKREKGLAEAQGEQKRIEVTEYSGLIGRTLDLAAKVFPGYEPVEKRELPAPENFDLPENPPAYLSAAGEVKTDNLTQIYNDYVAAHPEIFSATSTPETPAASGSAGSPETASSTPGSAVPAETAPAGPSESIPEPTSVNIIELPPEPAPVETPAVEPAPEPTPEPTPEPAPEPTPAPAQ